MKTTICCSKIYQTFQYDRMEDKEHVYFWRQVQMRNRIRTKILGSKSAFEFGPNLLGFQTGLEKSNKFSKILICLAF
jgi:hypothetical protein